MSDDGLNAKAFEQFIKALKGKLPIIKLGILGNDNARKNSAKTTNAEIGAKHEFGDDGMPVRSFLRMPIIDHMQEYLEKSKAFDKETLTRVIQEKSIIIWMKKVAIVGESIVSDAFDTGGFGKWRPSIMTHKKNQQTLVETKQLRESISSEVK